MLKHKRIYLVGMPASGKSTLGKALAEALSWSFLDLDTAIEQAQGKPVPEIFAQVGEPGFREMERTSLHANLPENTVIASGGGAPCFFDNMDWMKKHGLCIYLDVPAEELAKRAWKAKGKRPLLKSPTLEQLFKEIEKKQQERKKFYQKAHLTVEGKSIQIDQLLKAVMEAG